LGKASDTPLATAGSGPWQDYSFKCYDNILDVSATSTDGTTYTLTLGKVDIATLTITDPASLKLFRSWDPDDDVPSESLIVSGVGSAKFNQPDLSAVRMATPGSSGNVTLNFGAAQSLSYGPLAIPRTQTISNTLRADKLAICNAKTLADLAKAAPATSDFNLAASAPEEVHLCDAATANGFEQGVVDLNAAIDSGDFVKAWASARMLGLPLPEDDAKYVDFDSFSDDEWHLAYAVGGAACNQKKDGSFGSRWDAKKKSMIGLQGTGNYLDLINDMAECGVDPLASPPLSLDTIFNYYKNVQLEHSHEKVNALYAKLLAACQRVMSGLQVHYRNAGNTKTPSWERQDQSVVVLYVGGVLVEVGGKATVFPSVQAASDFVPPGGASVSVAPGRKATKKGPSKFPVVFKGLNAPVGFSASVSRAVYGRRYESSCEGMASFRLRTLPQYFSPVGVVCATLKTGGIGHCIAVFSGPGSLYLSSNGKEPIAVTKGLVQSATEAELVAIYSHGNPASTLSASDFDYGFGVTPKPQGETPAQRESIIDQVMLDAKVDEALHRNSRTVPGRRRAPLDWNNFLPSWA
jgi:hypothetical protein